MDITLTGISEKLVKQWRGVLRINEVDPELGELVTVNLTLRPGETLIVYHSLLVIAKDGIKFTIDRRDFREVEIL